jgi:hypothetical protein
VGGEYMGSRPSGGWGVHRQVGGEYTGNISSGGWGGTWVVDLQVGGEYSIRWLGSTA